eukprot:TRINITY_DN13739_c0_g1_i1.p1 TRINITY_DN13739_c0_g1~~TRINITY_DN13739_c0_g1_i1.p1  ORF type:complete len:597 (-),score=132.80 TRINITY_DN13739_c0_g1_i1:124-1785(-)
MNDAFGVKAEILMVALASLLGFILSIVIIMVVEQWMPWLSVMLILFGTMISVAGVWRPVVFSYIEEAMKRTAYRVSTSNDSQKEFLALMQDKKALKLFEQHLVREFCFENWAFLKDVKKLLEAINNNLPYGTIMRKVQGIHDQFISKDALTPINLSAIDRMNFINAYNALMENSGIIGDSNYARVISELKLTSRQCENAILYLLVSDSYRRFKMTEEFQSIRALVERDMIIRDALSQGIEDDYDPRSHHSSNSQSQAHSKKSLRNWSKDYLRKASEPLLPGIGDVVKSGQSLSKSPPLASVEERADIPEILDISETPIKPPTVFSFDATNQHRKESPIIQPAFEAFEKETITTNLDSTISAPSEFKLESTHSTFVHKDVPHPRNPGVDIAAMTSPHSLRKQELVGSPQPPRHASSPARTDSPDMKAANEIEANFPLEDNLQTSFAATEELFDVQDAKLNESRAISQANWKRPSTKSAAKVTGARATTPRRHSEKKSNVLIEDYGQDANQGDADPSISRFSSRDLFDVASIASSRKATAASQKPDEQPPRNKTH